MKERKRHLFLTGEVQVGKSTILRRILETASLPPEQLGVLKKWSYEFLEQVAVHPAVTVVTVTEENLEQIAALMTFACSLIQGSALQATPARESSQNNGENREFEKIF